jgi:N-acetylmuramoyl-L-alanine amidase
VALYNDQTFSVIVRKNFNAKSLKSTAPTVIIDAGHGGFDGGAVAADGTIEKDLNLKIALKLDAVLRVLGFNTVLTRNADLSMEDEDVSGSKKVSDMKNRLKLMQKYPNAVFISIHMNKFSTSQPNGTQVFYGVTEGSELLAKAIQETVKQRLQPLNHRVVKKTTKDIFLLYNSVIPSVIVECGFLSNPADLENLKSEDYQKAISWAIAEGVVKYYG